LASQKEEKSHLKFRRSDIVIPAGAPTLTLSLPHTNSQTHPHISLNQVKFLEEKSEIKGFENEGNPRR
jgi:hypothetical protein